MLIWHADASHAHVRRKTCVAIDTACISPAFDPRVSTVAPRCTPRVFDDPIRRRVPHDENGVVNLRPTMFFSDNTPVIMFKCVRHRRNAHGYRSIVVDVVRQVRFHRVTVFVAHAFVCIYPYVRMGTPRFASTVAPGPCIELFWTDRVPVGVVVHVLHQTSITPI